MERGSGVWPGGARRHGAGRDAAAGSWRALPPSSAAGDPALAPNPAAHLKRLQHAGVSQPKTLQPPVRLQRAALDQQVLSGV